MVLIILFSIYYCQHFHFGCVVKSQFLIPTISEISSDFASLTVRLHVKQLVHSASTDINLFSFFPFQL